MIDVFHIAQGDTLPYYFFKVRDVMGAKTLSDVTAAYFRMAPLTTGSYGSIVAGSTAVSALAVLTNALAGEGQYQWAAADTAVIGEYSANVLFVTPGGNYTLPRNEISKVIVEDAANTLPSG